MSESRRPELVQWWDEQVVISTSLVQVAALDGYKALSGFAEFVAATMRTDPGIDHFTTSLHSLLLFEYDLKKRNRIESLMTSAMANERLGNPERAISGLEMVIQEERNHLVAAEICAWIYKEREPVLTRIGEQVEP